MNDPRFERLLQGRDFRMPFDECDDGFDQTWWSRSVGRVRDPTMEFYRITDGEKDLSRAELKRDCRIHDAYVDLARSTRFVELVTLEVRNDFRGIGIGSAFVESILDLYPDSPYYVFAKQSAESFWEHMGWRERLRVDRDARASRLYTFRAR